MVMNKKKLDKRKNDHLFLLQSVILTQEQYIYSSKDNFEWPSWKNPAYCMYLNLVFTVQNYANNLSKTDLTVGWPFPSC